MSQNPEQKQNENLARRRAVDQEYVPSRPGCVWNLLKIIFFLLIVIVFLFLLIMMFGLGGGGGSWLPGSGNNDFSQSQNVPKPDGPTLETKPVVEPEDQPTKPDETKKDDQPAEKEKVRRELTISFVPSKADPDVAEPMVCNVMWTETMSKSRETRSISEANMADFEFALEKTIRTWLTSYQSTTTIDVPVVAVAMRPFPGEGVYRKIESIARQIDNRISIMRLEGEAATK